MVAKGELLAEKYLLERFLGSGGFASVWAARNIDIDRPVALKILSENLARVPDVVARFVREATLAARQIHETILRVEDIGKTRDDIPFLVMELLDGQTLSQEIKARGALPIMECVDICRLVLQGLATAHERGIIHRDIKPSNIFLTAPTMVGARVRILDLGLAKDLASATGVTSSGQWMGTPDYLPPELFVADQWRALGPTGDVFAVGITLFEMLTGRRPLDGVVPRGSSPSMLFKRIAYYESHIELPRALDVVTGVPPELDSVLRRALAVDPSRRYADAGQMLDALEHALALTHDAYPNLELIRTAVVRSSAPAPIDADQEMMTPTSRSSPRHVSYLVRRARDVDTEELVSGDLLAEDPSVTPTSRRRLARAEASSDQRFQGNAGTIDLATADLIEMPRGRTTAPIVHVGTLGDAGRLGSTPPSDPRASYPASVPAWKLPPAEVDSNTPVLFSPTKEPTRSRGLVLVVALLAMGASLIILAVVVVLTYAGTDVPQPTRAPILPATGPLEPSTSTVDPSPSVREAPITREDEGPDAGEGLAARADGGRSEPPSTPGTELHGEPIVAKRHPVKGPRGVHKVRRIPGDSDFGGAIPFDELGQQGAKGSRTDPER